MPNSVHGLGDREREILNECGSIGRVVAIRNIQREWNKIVGVSLFLSLLRSRDKFLRNKLVKRAIILPCIRD